MLKRVLGLLGWLGVALVFAAVAIKFLKPEWDPWRFRLALAGLVCVLLYILSEWRQIARSFSGRHARFGTLAGASVLVVIAILAAINYLGVRHTKRWDLTAAKQFSLADQTKKVLQGLDKPLQIKVFARSDEFPRFRERLEEYQHHAKQIAIQYIDPERDPRQANQYQIASLNTVVLEYDGRVERVTGDAEQELTNGLVKVVQGRQNKAYFVQGHGERSPEESDANGYSGIASLLKSQNFEHSTIVVAQQNEIPADATLLIVAGPKSDFLPNEIDALKKYLGKGGKVLFMIDPPDRVGAPELTNLTALLKEWAIEVGSGVIVHAPQDAAIPKGDAIDVAALAPVRGGDGTYVLAAKYNQHPVMQGFRRYSVYRLARAITPASGAEGRSAQTLVETTKSSWSESDLARLLKEGKVSFDPDKGDKEGPVSLAAAVSAPATDVPAPAGDAGDKKDEAPKPESRIVVFGDSDFASNSIAGFEGNSDLFLNAINWLGQQENMIAIRPRDPEDRRITMTADQQVVTFWLTVVVIPGLILVTGIWTWWRRR